MQIDQLTPAQWEQVTDSVVWLWLIVAGVILFNGSLLFGRSVLPSLVHTRSVPERAARLIPLFFVTGALAIIGVIVFSIMFSDSAQVFYDVFDRVWY